MVTAVTPARTCGTRGFRLPTDHRQPQTVTDDGTAFFTTPDPLAAADINGANDAYAYRDGQLPADLARHAGDRPGSRTRHPTARRSSSPPTTRSSATDKDRSFDMYMTRQGAGFASAAAMRTSRAAASIAVRQAWRRSWLRSPRSARSPAPGPSRRAPAAGGYGQGAAETKTVRGSAATLRMTVSGQGTIAGTGSGLRRVTKPQQGRHLHGQGLADGRSKATLKSHRTLRVNATVRSRPQGAQRVPSR